MWIHVNLYLEFRRAYPQKWLTCWSKENSGYDGIIFAVGKWKLIANRNLVVNWELAQKIVVNWYLAEKLVVNWELGTPISTLFQTWPLGRNYVIIILRLERKQKICLRIRIFLFSRCYSFGTETINTFIHSRSSPENHTRFLTKMGVFTRFLTQIPYPLRRHKPICFISGSNTHNPIPPPPWRARKAKMKYSQTLYRHTLNMDTSMLWTVSCVPGERRPLHFL